MYKASKYEVSPDMKHVLLAYNVAPVSFSFVCLFFELANWQANMSAASTGGWVIGSWCGEGREERKGEKVIMAGCEGLSHTAACQRWRRGPAQPSGTVARQAETQTNPSAPRRLAGREMRSAEGTGSMGVNHFCAILDKVSHDYISSASTLIYIKALNIGRSSILNHFACWCLCVYFILPHHESLWRDFACC